MLVLISGPSGAGKTTFVKALLKSDSRLVFSVSTTTRPPRKGEADGEQYHFVDEAEFDRLIAADAFIEWARVHEHRYGTCRDHLEAMVKKGAIPLLDLDVQGGLKVMELYGDRVVSVFLFPPSWAVLEERLRARQTDDESVIQTRLRNAHWEVSFAEKYEYFIVNDDLNTALDCMWAILTAEQCRRVRLGQHPLGKDSGPIKG